MYFQQSCGFNLYGITHMISNIITSYDNSSYIYIDIFKTYTIYIYIYINMFQLQSVVFLSLVLLGPSFCIQPILHGFGRTGAEIQVIICNSQQLLAGVGPWDMACRPAKRIHKNYVAGNSTRNRCFSWFYRISSEHDL